VLIPFCIPVTLLLVSQGVLQNFASYVEVTTLEGAKQVLAMGPVASQEVIKEFGTNGGGFFNANSAHPFESPNPLTNFIEMLLIFAIPASLTYTFGRMARDQRQGWAIFAAMAVLFLAGVAAAYRFEATGNPVMQGLAVNQAAGNMEGKEVRFGVVNSALFATVTTPQHVIKNPVMFVVEIGSVLTTLILLRDLVAPTATSLPLWFTFNVTFWLWFTVVFANFAEAVAEGRGKAQAATLRKMRKETTAPRMLNGKREETVPVSALRKGDVVIVAAGEIIPGDGEVIQGIASVDESAITGESAPVIRESGGDRSAVTGGTKVLSDQIVVRITASPGESFLDRMIALVEGAARQKTPNEIALNILLAGLTLVFLFACVTLVPMALYSGVAAVSITVIVALLVCLIPTTIGGLLSAIGIAGIDRLLRKNVLAMSGRAVEAAGDVDTGHPLAR
jgi:cation transport ATPase